MSLKLNYTIPTGTTVAAFVGDCDDFMLEGLWLATKREITVTDAKVTIIDGNMVGDRVNFSYIFATASGDVFFKGADTLWLTNGSPNLAAMTAIMQPSTTGDQMRLPTYARLSEVFPQLLTAIWEQ